MYRNDPSPIVSIIIPAMNERRTITQVIREASKVHPKSEIIVVANGSVDGTESLAEKLGARVIYGAEPLGHDVGRSVGTESAKGNVLLFIDGDMIIPAVHLRPFVRSVLSGVDVALNKYDGPIHRTQIHRVVLSKHILNLVLSRADLKGASLTAIPHALSRKAVETVGAEHLSIPPLAHAMAVRQGLTVEAVYAVEVGRMNPSRVKIKGEDPLEQIVVGDHLEAIYWITERYGERGGFEDLGRIRSMVR
ncbi:glycosyltransferase family 2 protein [Paenibacillus sediminis]|uniref:Glycosyltransferase involved in cell wall biosynthesis n=1 Tax=Paenibacillus sediminis TaxID=664909 RepID=A0ABS4H5X9_9BACL|nr:glycosyltransferase [Paenibacillus sediminis]MBP1937881.1 glycosyltransferase involved in cell wall biosynthesis [Paenibacillus sediminis]